MARVYLGFISLLLTLAGCASGTGQLAGPRSTTGTASDKRQRLLQEERVTTSDFLQVTSGRRVETIEVGRGAEKQKLSVGGGADLIAYVGHDGLMDFSLSAYPQRADDRKREAVILACASKAYFDRALRQTGAAPLLWTTGLTAPEAYVLKAAVDGWIVNEGGNSIKRRAAEAYNKYQLCGLKGAMNLFASGW